MTEPVLVETEVYDLNVIVLTITHWASLEEGRLLENWETVSLLVRKGSFHIHDGEAELRIRFHQPHGRQGRLNYVLTQFFKKAERSKTELRIRHPEAEAVVSEWLPTWRLAFDYSEHVLAWNAGKSSTLSRNLPFEQVKQEGGHVVFCNWKADEAR